MTQRFRKYSSMIKLFPTLDKPSRAAILKHMNKEFLNCICEICLNLLCGNIKVRKEYKKKLLRYKALIHKLAKKDNTSSNTKRRKLMYGRGFSLLPILFSAIAPVISRLVG